MTHSIVPLGDVAEFIRGVTYKPEDLMENFSKGSVVCMRTANIQETLIQDDIKSIPVSLIRSSEKFLRNGDILVSTANSWNLVGKCCWVPELAYAAVPGGFIAALRADSTKVDARYLYHWFNSPQTQTRARNCGRQTTNISNMDLTRCLALMIPLPSLVEQRRIAAILDKADALRVKRREAIAKLDQLLQSVFLDMFGDGSQWECVAIGEICAVKGGKRLPKGQDYSDSETPFRYIRVSDIESGRILEHQLKYLTPDVQRQIERYTVSKGDVIITIAGTIGAVAPVGENFSGANLTENAAKLVDLGVTPYEPEFLAFALSAPDAQHQIQAQTGQVTIGKLALFRIEKVTVPIPPLALQKRFVDLRRSLERKASLQAEWLALLDCTFSSLQHRAFSGAL